MAVVHVSAFRLVPLGFRNGIRSLLIINLSIEHLRRDDVTVDLPYAAGPEDSVRLDHRAAADATWGRLSFRGRQVWREIPAPPRHRCPCAGPPIVRTARRGLAGSAEGPMIPDSVRGSACAHRTCSRRGRMGNGVGQAERIKWWMNRRFFGFL